MKKKLLYLLTLLVLTTVYFFAGKLGLSFASINPSASAVWPPTGIALAAFLLLGYRVWPAILLGAFLVNISTAGSLATSTGIALGNTLEGLLGAFLVNKFAHGYSFTERTGDVFRFTFLAAVLSTMVSATIGVLTLAFGGYADWVNFWPIWFTWWLGDAVGALILTPPLILLFKNRSFDYKYKQLFELLILAGLLVLVGNIIFSGILPQPYISLPILIWIALRFSQRESVVAVFFLTILAIRSTLQSTGPFVGTTPNDSLLLLQLFMGTIAVMNLAVSATAFERRKAEETLKESEDRYKKLIDTSPDAIVVTDLEGRIQVVNEQVLTIYGFKTAKELIGKNGFDLIAKEDQERTRKALTDVIKEGKINNLQYVSTRKDGTRFFTEASASLLLDSQDLKKGRLIAVVRDITERKKIEKMKTDFFSIAAHQLRSPLSVIRWSMESLLSDTKNQFSQATKKLFENVYGNTRLLIERLDKILHIAQSEEGVTKANPQTINVHEQVKKIATDLKVEIDEKKIKLKLNIKSGEKPQALLDPQQFYEVIQNLIRNAIKYNKNGGEILVDIKDLGKDILITVTDTGIGIPKDDQKRIFEKFFRAKNVFDINPHGSGLGLFLVQLYVRKWGGKVWFTSEEEKGSIFSVQFPKNIILRQS